MRQFLSTARKLLVCSLACLFFLPSCVKDDATVDVALVNKLSNEKGQISTEWINLSLELTKETPGFTVPVAARTFAYIGLGMYEVLVPGMKDYKSMQGKLAGFTTGTMHEVTTGNLDWALSFNECMYRLYKMLYRNSSPAGLEAIEKLYNKHLNAILPYVSKTVAESSISYGAAQASAIYSYSKTDNQEDAFLNNYPSNYSGPNGQGFWSPTSNKIRKPLQPYWGQVRTFLAYHTIKAEMIAPPSFSEDKTSSFYAYALEVRNRVENLSRQEEVMVKYWNDEQDNSITPAGHLMSILAQILDTEKKDLGFCAFAFMKLGITLHDATVMAWKTKYTYNTVRPETYIREYIDNEFLSLINPTATPEYSSSPAALAAASAEVLGGLFGYNYAFTDRTYEFRKDIDGSPRSFKSFEHMEEEISTSNLYGGIHYRFSLEAGEKQGVEIGKGVNAIR